MDHEKGNFRYSFYSWSHDRLFCRGAIAIAEAIAIAIAAAIAAATAIAIAIAAAGATAIAIAGGANPLLSLASAETFCLRQDTPHLIGKRRHPNQGGRRG